MAKKWFVRGEPGVTGTLGKAQQPFRPNPNGVGDRTTILRWWLIAVVAQSFSSRDHHVILFFKNCHI